MPAMTSCGATCRASSSLLQRSASRPEDRFQRRRLRISCDSATQKGAGRPAAFLHHCVEWPPVLEERRFCFQPGNIRHLRARVLSEVETREQVKFQPSNASLSGHRAFRTSKMCSWHLVVAVELPTCNRAFCQERHNWAVGWSPG